VDSDRVLKPLPDRINDASAARNQANSGRLSTRLREYDIARHLLIAAICRLWTQKPSD